MLLKTKGIVLRKMNYRETSVIVEVFTLDVGLRSLLINGVRKSKTSKHANQFQIMNQLDLIIYDKKPTGLNYIKESKPIIYYDSIPFDIKKSLVGQFMVEVLRKTVNHDEANENMYVHIVEWFTFLDQTKESINNLLPIFLIELAGQIGYAFEPSPMSPKYLDLKEGKYIPEIPDHGLFLSSELSDKFEEFLHSKKESSHTIAVHSNQRSQLIDQLLIFFKYHIESFHDLKSIDILREILH